MHPCCFGIAGQVIKRAYDNISIYSRGEQFCLLNESTAANMSGIQRANAGITEPHENDVLMGRGGKNNRHSGNEKLRQLARLHAEDYISATKKGKSQISRLLVQQMRELSPSAR
jgi:hypothetical protein